MDRKKYGVIGVCVGVVFALAALVLIVWMVDGVLAIIAAAAFIFAVLLGVIVGYKAAKNVRPSS